MVDACWYFDPQDTAGFGVAVQGCFDRLDVARILYPYYFLVPDVVEWYCSAVFENAVAVVHDHYHSV